MADRAFPALSDFNSADCNSADLNPVEFNLSEFNACNQEAYLRFKLCLSLNLRRQIFIAVCDDLALRNRLAARLSFDLGNAIPTLAVLPTVAGEPATVVVGSPLHQTAGTQTAGTAKSSLTSVPPLVSLDLDFGNPNPVAQITQWVKQSTTTKHLRNGDRLPNFQILGIEGLTRKSAGIQKRFLDHLQHIGNHPTGLDSSLILWLTRPWFRMVQLSASAFWQAHTALFEFEGDPTPAPAVARQSASALLSTPRPAPPVNAAAPSPTFVNGSPADPAAVSPAPVSASSLDNAQRAAATVPSAALPPAPGSTSEPPRRALWELLADDLEQFDEPIQPAALEEFEEPLLHLDNAADRRLDVAPILMSDTGFVPPVYTFHPPLESPLHPVALPVQPSSAADLLDHAAAQALLDAAATAAPPALDFAAFDLDLAATEIAAADATTLEFEVIVPPDSDLDIDLDSDLADIADRPAAELQITDQIAASPVLEATSAIADIALPILTPDIDRDWIEMVRTSANSTAHSLAPGKAAEILQALAGVEQLHQRGATLVDFAAAYRSLGNLYRDCIEQGNTSEATLLIAIRTYEQTLEWLEDTAAAWSDVLNDMGNLYWMLSRKVTDPEVVLLYLEQGIAAYYLALAPIDPQANPQSYAMLQNNLGSAYGDLARYQDPAVALQNAVQAYAESLRYRDPEEDAARYAATQNNLGTAYWNLAQHEQPVARLKQAIAAYVEALRYYSPEREPLHYAMIQNNLGTAYWNLAQQISNSKKLQATESVSARELLLHAINAYRDALGYRTLAQAPAAYAATQNNLGTAFWNLATLPDTEAEIKQDALEAAIAAYTEALAAVQQLQRHAQDGMLTFDRFATHNNLGLVHYHLATAKNSPLDATSRTQSLETALQHHLHAMQGWTNQPDYANTAMGYLVQTVRAFYTQFGMKGQSIALSRVPANLLPELMQKL